MIKKIFFLITNSHLLKFERSCIHEQNMQYVFTGKIQITFFCRLWNCIVCTDITLMLMFLTHVLQSFTLCQGLYWKLEYFH